MRALLLAILAGLTACTVSQPGITPAVCSSDNDCKQPEVCFPDGCGDPSQKLVVEVLPNTQAGQNAQDLPVDEVHPIQNIQLSGPSVVTGKLTQASAPGTPPQPYTGRVMVRAVGESALIPGRLRTYGVTLTLIDGTFAVPVGTGTYSVIVTAADTRIPPLTLHDVSVSPGQVVTLPPRVLPPTTSLLVLSGSLVRTALDPSALGAPFEVQAVDPATQNPLSQRVRIDPTTGAFTLYAAPEAAGKPLIGIQAIPVVTSGTALVPRKLFTVSTTAALPALELGDFGQSVAVSGRLLGSNGRPIANATVYLDGHVPGGGSFTSASVRTGDDGRFSQLLTLPSDPAGGFSLWAIPPPTSASGQLRTSVSVLPTGGDLGDFNCPDRVPVQGMVQRPDGKDFPGVQVIATAVAPLDDNHPMPVVGSSQTTTNTNSSYTLNLDPGIWQLAFIAPEQLPQMSHQVTVKAQLSDSGGNQIIAVPKFNFSRGRTVQGTITGFLWGSTTDLAPAPFASVRFYRVDPIGGRPTATLLAEGVTDQEATYSVVLPTR